MPEPVGFRCRQCGKTFVVPILTDDERRRLHREGRRGSPIICEHCESPEVERI